MRLTFTVKCTIDPGIIEARAIESLSKMPIRLSELNLADFVDFELADAGVVGGEVWLHVASSDPLIKVAYWIPKGFPAEYFARLEEYTVAQLDDGVGEGGFEILFENTQILLLPNVSPGINSEMIDDGRSVSVPSKLAMFARDGHIALLEKELSISNSEIEVSMQGYSPLQLSILSGHQECSMLLINAGANPNIRDLMGSTPLHLTALSNRLNDSQSRVIAMALLQAGADRNAIDDSGNSAKNLADARGKSGLSEVLQDTVEKIKGARPLGKPTGDTQL